MKQQQDNYVHEEKKKLIEEILSDPVVRDLYDRWQALNPANSLNFRAREKLFKEYAKARDERFGLPPINFEKVHPGKDKGQ